MPNGPKLLAGNMYMYNALYVIYLSIYIFFF